MYVLPGALPGWEPSLETMTAGRPLTVPVPVTLSVPFVLVQQCALRARLVIRVTPA